MSRRGFFDLRYKNKEPIHLDKLGTELQTAGVILKGKADNTLYLYLPEEEIPPEDKRQHKVFDAYKWTTMLYQLDRPMYVEEDKDGNVKAIFGRNKRMVGSNIQWDVYRRADYKCEYCGRDDVALTIDHYIPVAHGGTDDKENLRACCRKCNRRKGDMTPKEWEEYNSNLQDKRDKHNNG